jgi:hypothetical protein
MALRFGVLEFLSAGGTALSTPSNICHGVRSPSTRPTSSNVELLQNALTSGRNKNLPLFPSLQNAAEISEFFRWEPTPMKGIGGYRLHIELVDVQRELIQLALCTQID